MDFIQYHFWFWSVLFTSMLDQSLKKKKSVSKQQCYSNNFMNFMKD